MKRAVLLLTGLALSAASMAAVDMKPGLWEISMQSEMANTPPMPANKFQHCFRPGDMKDPRKLIPQKDPGCKVTEARESGRTVNWKVACTGKMTYTASGTVTYTSESYSGNARIKMKHGNQFMEMTQKLGGKRLGNCKE